MEESGGTHGCIINNSSVFLLKFGIVVLGYIENIQIQNTNGTKIILGC